MVEIDMPAYYLNPIASIQECLEQLINIQKEKVDTVSWEVDDLDFKINSLWRDGEDEEAEGLEEELSVLKYNLEDEENILSNYERIKNQLLSSPFTVVDFTKEVLDDNNYGLLEPNLFGEEVRVVYMKRVSIETSGIIPSPIIKRIEEMLLSK